MGNAAADQVQQDLEISMTGMLTMVATSLP